MKISEVTVQNLVDFLRIDDPVSIETDEISRMMSSAKAQIRSYTGLTDDEIDEHEDLTQAFFIIVADMFDNRNLQLDYKSVARNKSVDQILGMHSINLL